MNIRPNPRRIEWAGPERWTVWADEDGVHVRSKSGDALEEGDVTRLFDLWQLAKQEFSGDSIPAPKPPTPDERGRYYYGPEREEYDAKRAARAVYDALAPTTDPAF